MGVGNERISFRVLPATKAICIYHKGAYDRLGKAYAYIYRYALEKRLPGNRPAPGMPHRRHSERGKRRRLADGDTTAG